jgi:hypothetical protein
VDLNKLTLADKVIAGSAIGLFIFMFFPWFTVEVEGGGFFGDFSENFSGFDVGFLWGTFPMMLGLAMLAQVAISRFAEQVQLPEVPWSRIHLGLGIAAAVLVVLKLLIGEDGGVDGATLDAAGVSVSRAFGIFLSALAAIGLAVGGFFKFQEGDDGAAAGGPPTNF